MTQRLTGLLDAAESVAGICAGLAAEADATRTFPAGAFQAIARQGLLGAPLPGGAGDLLELLLILKHIGRGDLSVGRIFEGHVNALQLIQTFGTPSQIERWSIDARERDMIFAVWNTEAGDGVRLTPVGDSRFRMTGAKTFASGAGDISQPIVPGALPGGGWQMCVVPLDEVSVSIDPSWWRPPGMHASTSFKVDFTGVELDVDWLLGEPDDYRREPWFSGGAIRFAAVHLGGAEALLNEAVQFLRSLDRTGDPFQQARFGEAAILIESGNSWLRSAAETVDLGPECDQTGDVATMVNYAHMTRLAIERICLDIMEITTRAVGARGLLQPLPIERILRDLTLYLRQPAPDAALASVGRHVLDRDAPVHRIWRTNGT